MRKLLFALPFLLLPLVLSAGGGMWLPLLLENLNEEEMKGMGMKITAEDIYSINQGSLKDAIVHFGGFCTGEVISDQGLVLTNHHCGFSAIQDHSTLEDNLLENGFYAQSKSAEKSNPGLYVMFIERIEDVTGKVLNNVYDDMSEDERSKLIAENLKSTKENFELKAHEELIVKPFYNGNQYFAFVTKRYSDVRLVGAPPSSIGKFGADTDNWEWPRHTGDFSLFRIYTAPDGSPAEYSADNIPMKPKKHLEVSLEGVKPGDFSMIFGFPGRTDQYLSADAMQQRTEVINPIRIGMRDLSLAVIDSAMRADAQIKIDYASKQARIANAWKKWRGESEGVAAVNGIEKRRAMEREFMNRLEPKPVKSKIYTPLLGQINDLVTRQEEVAKTNAYSGELNYNIDMFRIANILRRQVKIADNNGIEAFKQRLPAIIGYLEGFYKGYNPKVDMEVAKALLPVYYENVPEKHLSFHSRDQVEFAGSMDRMITDLFQRSYLTKGDRLIALLKNDPENALDLLRGDMGYVYVAQLNQHNEKRVINIYNEIQQRAEPLQRQYMKGLMLFFPEKRLYPDANSTMRVSYGKVEGFTGLDGKKFDYITDLDGVIAKYQPGDYEFDLPLDLIELHKNEDYGKYAMKNGKLPVCFLGSNHTTGGNSGSPALDAKGRLVGLNFDRTWQSTMSDVNYDPSICRNIMVDIRYVLFLIDKLGGAPHLVEEMTLVK
ncbi:S46 family peptidase [Neolewinella aurantiaca]|uniref:Dipeptidyl-peptidase n=1 Tax=Neolewinella aurantiaca TaxID=2602767 RepID=A0A5C7FR80_9BACT|nr:S46 family peptidase [Neolewinella aurantiaca]TXF90423.1 S46 family peptidase [Neolewinella aurantiaca]